MEVTALSQAGWSLTCFLELSVHFIYCNGMRG